jgi:hypothetical protein
MLGTWTSVNHGVHELRSMLKHALTAAKFVGDVIGFPSYRFSWGGGSSEAWLWVWDLQRVCSLSLNTLIDDECFVWGWYLSQLLSWKVETLRMLKTHSTFACKSKDCVIDCLGNGKWGWCLVEWPCLELKSQWFSKWQWSRTRFRLSDLLESLRLPISLPDLLSATTGDGFRS